MSNEQETHVQSHRFTAALSPPVPLETSVREDDGPEWRSERPGGPGWIERRAKLIEAGEYPDKGVTITSDQLAALASAFNEPVPVLIEHSESPLEMGFLVSVEALGSELFGTVALTKEANDHLLASEARALSLGLTPDLTGIREVSLVRNPRVSGAQLFSADRFCGEFCGEGERRGAKDESDSADGSDRSDRSVGFKEHAPGGDPWRKRYEELSDSNRRADAHREVESFVKEGRLCPAQAPFAEAMLMAEDTIEFDGESRPLRQLLIAMIERQPPMGLFSAIVPDDDRDGQATFLPEEAAFYRKHFPDVSLEEIAARKGR